MNRTARLHAGGDIRLHDEPDPVVGEGEVLLRITGVGICGSDLHWFEEGAIGDATLTRPLVLGHEFGGVAETGLWAGRTVAVEPALHCGTCRLCEEGHPNLCQNVRFAGHGSVDGAFRHRMAWPESALFPLPGGFDGVDGALLEPLGVAIHALDLAKPGVGVTAGVFGCGPIGLLVLQLARLAGASRITATDVLPHRLDAALDFGADWALEAFSDASEGAQVRRLVGGEGLDVAFEAAGENPAVEAALDALRPGGLLVLLGIPADDRTSVQASVARRKGITVKWVRRMKFTYPRAIALVERGRVDVRSLVTHRFPLERIGDAFETARRRDGLKVVVQPD